MSRSERFSLQRLLSCWLTEAVLTGIFPPAGLLQRSPQSSQQHNPLSASQRCLCVCVCAVCLCCALVVRWVWACYASSLQWAWGRYVCVCVCVCECVCDWACGAFWVCAYSRRLILGWPTFLGSFRAPCLPACLSLLPVCLSLLSVFASAVICSLKFRGLSILVCACNIHRKQRG